MIKLEVWAWGDYLGLASGHNIITKVLRRGRWEGQSQRRRCDMRRWPKGEVTLCLTVFQLGHHACLLPSASDWTVYHQLPWVSSSLTADLEIQSC